MPIYECLLDFMGLLGGLISFKKVGRVGQSRKNRNLASKTDEYSKIFPFHSQLFKNKKSWKATKK